MRGINAELRDLERRREKSSEEEAYNESKFVLRGDAVIETSSIDGCGEPVSIETIYLSQDAARLILDPSPVIMLSENTGLSVEDILKIAKGTLNAGAKIAAEVAGISALSAVATWVGVYGVNKFLSDTFYAKPKIDQALSNCEEGDYIYIRSAFSMGGGYNSTFRHTDGNEVFPVNYESYNVEYNEGEINGEII